MDVVQLHIVGFPHRKDLEGHVDEFLVEAPGHAMTLRPQRGNDHDKQAIRAFDWLGRFVGYVSQKDLPTAWGALRCSGCESLRGMIASTNIEHPCAVFECKVTEYDGPIATLYPQQPFLDWQYSGPILNLPEELDNLEYMMDEIHDRLAELTEWGDDDLQYFVKLLERFAQCSKYDISGEMNDYRRRLIVKLRDTDIDELEEVIEQLEMAFGRSGREAMSGDVLRFWMRQMQSAETTRQLMVHRREYDVATIIHELEQFPESMFYVWQENRELFVSKVLYMHIPRRVLWRLISGIAFYEAMSARNELDAEAEMMESPVYLKTAKGQKIDMIRVLNALYEQGRFYGKGGSKLTKKDYFVAMGRSMNVDLSDYDKDLSRSMSDSTKLEKHTRVFEDLKQTMVDIWNSK